MALSSLATPAVINTSDYKPIIVYAVPLGVRPVVTAPVSMLYISLTTAPSLKRRDEAFGERR